MNKTYSNKSRVIFLSATSVLLFVFLYGCTPVTKQMVSMGGESNLGIRLVQEKKYDEAIVELNRVIATHPQINGTPWNWLGVAHMNKHMYRQAARDFEQALVAGNAITGKGIAIPERASLYMNLGWAYFHGFRDYNRAVSSFETAEKWLNRSREHDLVWTGIRSGLGWSRYYQGDFQKAMNEFILAAPQDGSKPGYYGLYRGLFYGNLALKQDDSAAKWLARAQAAGNPHHRDDLMSMLLVQGRHDELAALRGGLGWIGINILEEPTGGLPNIRLVNIDPEGPAARSGLARGDIIRSIDGQQIASTAGFAAKVASLTPGTTVQFDLLRNNQSVKIPVTIGSVESEITRRGELIPVQKIPPVTLAAITASVPQISAQDTAAPVTPAAPAESKDTAPPAVSKETGPVINIDALSIIPEAVPAGELFEIRIDLYAENPEDPASKIPVTFTYAISRDGKVLKQFDPEILRVSNGATETIIKKTRAAKTPGDYTLDIDFDQEGEKAHRSASFSIR